MNHQIAGAQLGAIVEVDERAATGADHLVLLGHDLGDRLALQGPKCSLAVLAKNLGNGPPGHLLDVAVGVDKVEPQPPRDVTPERGLAAAAEADQDQVIHSPLDTTQSCAELRRGYRH